MAGRLEEELQRIREELDALALYAPRNEGELYTEEQEEYISEMIGKWASGEPWSPEDVPRASSPQRRPPRGGSSTGRETSSRSSRRCSTRASSTPNSTQPRKEDRLSTVEGESYTTAEAAKVFRVTPGRIR